MFQTQNLNKFISFHNQHPIGKKFGKIIWKSKLKNMLIH